MDTLEMGWAPEHTSSIAAIQLIRLEKYGCEED